MFLHLHQNNPADAPVLLWLEGGPGGSSLFALFAETGPFYVTKDLKCRLLIKTQCKLFVMVKGEIWRKSPQPCICHIRFVPPKKRRKKRKKKYNQLSASIALKIVNWSKYGLKIMKLWLIICISAKTSSDLVQQSQRNRDFELCHKSLPSKF